MECLSFNHNFILNLSDGIFQLNDTEFPFQNSELKPEVDKQTMDNTTINKISVINNLMPGLCSDLLVIPGGNRGEQIPPANNYTIRRAQCL